ncbi:MAG TPA: 5-methyltetrahydropteroyltriglutamate--homocysteine methyltransferase [Xanthobacteraceae bacterium]|nr:5-methyltetrahydropteroyltriglutamate--homocysteine methyltransferase [Xanthobacteraceae bacterium]
MAVLMPTTIVGSLPQPDWLVNKDIMLKSQPPRVRLKTIWRVEEPFLEQAQDDATYQAIRTQEDIGLDIISDGEIRRESYFNRFANALGGIDIDNPAEVEGRNKTRQIVPRVIGEIRRIRPVQVRDVAYMRAVTRKPIKITMPGPFTMMRLAKDEYYGDKRALLMAYAKAVNEEARELKDAGADVIQLDEPFVESFVEEAEELAVDGINRALEGIAGPTVVHLCFGYGHYVKVEKPNTYRFLAPLNACQATQISIEAAQPRLDPKTLDALPDKQVMVGVLDLKDHSVETPQLVAERLRAALTHITPDRLVVAPDCGMKYLPREVAYAKLRAMVAGRDIVRGEVTR